MNSSWVINKSWILFEAIMADYATEDNSESKRKQCKNCLILLDISVVVAGEINQGKSRQSMSSQRI